MKNQIAKICARLRLGLYQANWQAIAMRQPIHLTFEAVVALLARTFEKLPDKRDPARIKYPIRDSALSAFAIFFFQHPSLLQFQHKLKQKRGRSNLETVFGVREVPSDTQLRDILDGAPTEPLRRSLAVIFNRFRRSGWACQFRTSEALGKRFYPVAIDGTDYFCSSEINCPGCLRRSQSDGTISYRHSILSATLIKPRSHQILPIDAEPILNSDGDEKQDCEVNAGKRLAERLRREHPRLDMLILGDAMFAHEPMIEHLRGKQMAFLLSVKPGSHKETFEWVEELERLGDWVERGSWTQGPAAKRRYFDYRIVREVPLSQSRKLWVTFIEVWERDKAGEQKYHSSWVTDLKVNGENIEEIIWVGRGRWKIENENFNTHKNGGYELEHNYGHGKHTLSTVFYYLNVLAFVAHKILERSDATYKKLREKWTLRDMWQGLRYCFHRFLVESWRELLKEYDPELELESG